MELVTQAYVQILILLLKLCSWANGLLVLYGFCENFNNSIEAPVHGTSK